MKRFLVFSPFLITSLSVRELTQSGLSFFHRYGISLNCISMPFRLTMTTAPSTDCWNNWSKVRFHLIQTPESYTLIGIAGVLQFTFGSGSSRNPMANVTIITMIADSNPATWGEQKTQLAPFAATCWPHFLMPQNKSLFNSSVST